MGRFGWESKPTNNASQIPVSVGIVPVDETAQKSVQYYFRKSTEISFDYRDSHALFWSPLKQCKNALDLFRQDIGLLVSDRNNPVSTTKTKTTSDAPPRMGRYTTVQTFTDQDAKAAISYSAATTTASKDVSHYGPGGGGGDGDAQQSGGNSADKHNDPKVNINRVENVSGSSAGAGSGDFHMYRAARRRYASALRLLCVGPAVELIGSMTESNINDVCVCFVAIESWIEWNAWRKRTR